MTVLIDLFNAHRDICGAFLRRLEVLFFKMDFAYQKTADCYGFVCTGCDDNCCRTLFYHHSLLEYLYLYVGFETLERPLREKITHRAPAACREVPVEVPVEEQKGTNRRPLCLLNRQNLCLLYHYRPMICRLHGIPHELATHGRATMFVPGCEAFTQRCGEQHYVQFDRTPLYMEMAELEKEFRSAVRFSNKIKMTVAEMIRTFSDNG